MKGGKVVVETEQRFVLLLQTHSIANNSSLLDRPSINDKALLTAFAASKMNAYSKAEGLISGEIRQRCPIMQLLPVNL